ncbi:phosphotransferase, partial [Candidatus Pacearchaeota archaeon]|nr:phosphotransferase [Candidatus Pacearchaeota archaeon]
MEFKDYKNKINCTPFYQTEQSEIFITEKGTVCKYYFNIKDKTNEIYFNHFFNKECLLKTPEIYLIGDNFIEMEFLKKEEPFNIEKTIEEISKLYKKTWNKILSIKPIDLSKEKLSYRLNYLKEEIKKRNIDPKILCESKKFINKQYIFSDKNCVIHGDLKSAHIIFTNSGIKFIDLALAGISNPWYDLSFLCMEEQKDKKKIFKETRDLSYSHFGHELGLNKNKI